jgi:hypothetical protein
VNGRDAITSAAQRLRLAARDAIVDAVELQVREQALEHRDSAVLTLTGRRESGRTSAA